MGAVGYRIFPHPPPNDPVPARQPAFVNRNVVSSLAGLGILLGLRLNLMYIRKWKLTMKHIPVLKILIPLIFLLSLFAAATGLFYDTPGEPYPYAHHRGETDMLNGHGLYFYNTVSTAAQMQGNT